MRIALMTETTGPGGLETRLVILAEELRDRGHEVVPIIPSAPAASGAGSPGREGGGWRSTSVRSG